MGFNFLLGKNLFNHTFSPFGLRDTVFKNQSYKLILKIKRLSSTALFMGKGQRFAIIFRIYIWNKMLKCIPMAGLMFRGIHFCLTHKNKKRFNS